MKRKGLSSRETPSAWALAAAAVAVEWQSTKEAKSPP
jgi:hypothetical protein